MSALSLENIRTAGYLADNIRHTATEEGARRGVIMVVDRDGLNPLAIRTLSLDGYGGNTPAAARKQAMDLKAAEQSIRLARNSRRSATELAGYLKDKNNRTPAAYFVSESTNPTAAIFNEGLIATLVTPDLDPVKSAQIVADAHYYGSSGEIPILLNALSARLDSQIQIETPGAGGYVIAAILNVWDKGKLLVPTRVIPIYLQGVGAYSPGGADVVKAKIMAVLKSGQPSGHPDFINDRRLSPLQGGVPIHVFGLPRVVGVSGLYDAEGAPAGEKDRLLIESVAKQYGVAVLGTIPPRS